jgi:hypothetical protein
MLMPLERRNKEAKDEEEQPQPHQMRLMVREIVARYHTHTLSLTHTQTKPQEMRLMVREIVSRYSLKPPQKNESRKTESARARARTHTHTHTHTYIYTHTQPQEMRQMVREIVCRYSVYFSVLALLVPLFTRSAGGRCQSTLVNLFCFTSTKVQKLTHQEWPDVAGMRRGGSADVCLRMLTYADVC